MTGPDPSRTHIRALWPDPAPEPLDDAALLDRYRIADRRRPWLRLNFVCSVDGAVSVDGYSAGLSGAADKRVFGLLRTLCDGLLVGAGTLREEGYGALTLNAERRSWRTAHGLAPDPTLVVVSSRLDLDPASPAMAQAPVRPVILTHTGAPADRRHALAEVADVLAYGAGAVDLGAALTGLADRGLRQILSEGGPHVLGALTAGDLVDEVCLTVSPLLVGAGAGRITAGAASPAVRRLGLAHVLAADDVLLLRYIAATAAARP